MRSLLLTFLVLAVACSDNPSGRTLGDTVTPSDSNTGGDTMTGDHIQGDHSQGDSNSGDTHFGDSNVGDSNLGDSNVGDSRSGDSNLGDSNVGDPGTLAIDVIITEFRAVTNSEGEFVEIYNRGSAAVDIGAWTINGAAIDHPDSPGAAIIVPPLTYSRGLGAPNTMPEGVPWAYGIANLADTGDTLVLADGNGNVIDTVDFTSIHTDPNTAIPTNAFPAVVDVSTQLDLATVNGDGDNNNGAQWCVTFRVKDTGGSANQSCTQFVINEVLYDWRHPVLGSTDFNRTFVEIAGPGGGFLAGIRLSGIAGAGAVGQDQPPIVNFAEDLRMPVDGLLVVADGEADGSTLVPGADIVLGSGDPQNGPDAIKLRVRDSGATIDIVGYGTAIAGGHFETAPIGNIIASEIAISIARDATSNDSNNNSADFHFDPTPTPGTPNDVVVPTVITYAPNNSVVVASPSILTMTTLDFTSIQNIDGDANDNQINLELAGVAGANCVVIDALDDGRGIATVSCAPGDGTTPVRGDVVLSNPPPLGGSAVVADGWTYTGVNNETDSAAEADWCNLQHPAEMTVAAGATSENVYGQVFETGVTETAGMPEGVLAELGYGPIGDDPTVTGSWVWTTAAWNVQVSDNDEFVAKVTIPDNVQSGTYWYTFRYSFDSGLTFTYGDTDAAGSTGGYNFASNRLGILTVP